jgi:hypothetical protein
VATIDITHLARSEPDVRHLCVEHLRVRLREDFLLTAPSAAFKEEAINVSSIFGSSLQIVFLRVTHHFEVKVDLIDGYDMLSGVVLLNTSQEALCEEES